MFFKPIFINLFLLNLFILTPKVIIGIYEDDSCNQGDAYRRNCLVCLCSTKTNRWSCKNDICNDCNDDEIQRKDDSNFYCKNGRWTLLPFLQFPEPKRTLSLSLGPCKSEMFKPDWPCNRCQCNQTENVWECPLELCREETMLKNYSPKVHESRLDRLYEFFKYDGTKEICRDGEIRDGDDCNRCNCKETIWWCKLKECPDIIEQESVLADTLPEFLDIELPPGMESIKEHETDGIIKICNPGSKYKKGCNTCNCSMDGTAETCTQNRCDILGNVQDEFVMNYYDEEEFEKLLNNESGEDEGDYGDYYEDDNDEGDYNENYGGDDSENYNDEDYNENDDYKEEYNENYNENYDVEYTENNNEDYNENYNENSYENYNENNDEEYNENYDDVSSGDDVENKIDYDLNDAEEDYDKTLDNNYVNYDESYYEYYNLLEDKETN